MRPPARRLCNARIPAWLASNGIDETKVAAFYDDPVKTACYAWSAAKAHSFRAVTIDGGIYWQARRWARFMAWFGEGRLRDRLDTEPKFRAQSSSSSSSSSSSPA